MPRNYAPIGISTYKRIGHLKKTITSLKNNPLAKYSDLYFFSDAPRTGDENEVNLLRGYIKTIKDFKSIHIVERKTNNRVLNNRTGISYLLDKYKKCIFLEEDIVTAPGFLEYMNQGLDFYKNDEKVISICGYSPPIQLPNSYSKDYFTLKRFSAWGMGIWKSKFDSIEKYLNKEEVLVNLKISCFLKQLIENGTDIPQMLLQEIDGKIDALDVKIMYQQVLNDWYTIYPKKSLVQNIGHDGSGVHCGVSNKFHHDTLWDKTEGFVFDDDIIPNQEIVKANFDFRFSMNYFSKEMIISYLVRQIEKLENDSFSIYGIGELTNLLLARLYIKRCTKKINYFIDSKAETGTIIFNGENVVSAKEALENGEKNFVIVSWNSKKIIRNNLLKLCSGLSIKTIEPNILQEGLKC